MKVSEEVEIVGIKDTRKTVCTGVEMFRKVLDSGAGGRQCGSAASGYKARRGGARPGSGASGIDHPAHEVQGRDVHPGARRKVDVTRRFSTDTDLSFTSAPRT